MSCDIDIKNKERKRNVEQQKNRMFMEMKKAAWKRLKGCEPKKIQEMAGMMFEETKSAFYVNSLGKKVRINYPGFEIEGAFNEWHELVLLHYLEMADGTPLSKKTITYGELPQGMVRGGRFDRESERILGQCLDKKPIQKIEEISRMLGADIVEAKADFSAVFWFLPRYPITMNFWFSDDEFPASGKLLLDSSAAHYLSVEDAVTAGTILLEVLQKELL